MRLNDLTVGLVAAVLAVGVAATIDEAQAQSTNTTTSQSAQKRKPHAKDVSNPSTVWGTGGSGPADVNQNGREDIEDYSHAGDVTVQQSKERAKEGANEARDTEQGYEEGVGGSGKKPDAGMPHRGSYEAGKTLGQGTREGVDTTKEMGREVGSGVKQGAHGIKEGYEGAAEPPADGHEDAHDVGVAVGRGAARVREETKKAAEKIEGAIQKADEGFREGYGGSGKSDGGTKMKPDGGTK